MNPTLLLPILLVLVAGSMVALQAPTNAMLAKAGGSPVLAALISFGVGTAALRDPRTPERIVRDLARWCDRQGVKSISELVGALEWPL